MIKPKSMKGIKMTREYLGELEFTDEIIKRTTEYLNGFKYCPKESPPNIRLKLTNKGWRIGCAVCTLKSFYKRGIVFDSCNACKIKKETGKYPGEDFNPLNMLSGKSKELIKSLYEND